jgi:hypothetical protein
MLGGGQTDRQTHTHTHTHTVFGSAGGYPADVGALLCGTVCLRHQVGPVCVLSIRTTPK